MMGNSGSISLATFATSQPPIVPRRLMSVTSARYLVKPPLSKVTASYIQIENSGALEAVPECFATDAIVRDEGQTFEGVAAIKNWMAATRKKYGHTVAPLEFAERGGHGVLKARLAGSFAGSPITVSFSFVLAGGKIHSLEIR